MNQNKQSTIHFQSLDAFRGLAAIMVVLYHSQFFISEEPNRFVKHSYIFVDFFFILSGFVMTYAYLSRIENSMSLKVFSLLRFARLYPLHLFTLLIWVPFIVFKIYLYQHGVGTTDPLIDNNIITFLQNLFLLQGFNMSTSWNYPSWSIGVEFYTYLIFYIVVILLSKLSITWKYIGFSAISLLFFYLLFTSTDTLTRWHNTYRCISEFFLGAVLFGLYRYYGNLKTAGYLFPTLIETMLLLGMIYAVTHLDDGKIYEYASLLLFALIILFFAIDQNGFISQLLTKKPFQHLGKISYSIYMTHAIIVTGAYNVLVYMLHLKTGLVKNIPTGIYMSNNALWINILLIGIIVLISTWTYRMVELRGQSYIKRKFLP